MRTPFETKIVSGLTTGTLIVCLALAGQAVSGVPLLAATTTTRVSVASNGTQGNGDSYYQAISADGRFVTFNSSASTLVSGDNNSHADIFLNDRLTGQTIRISIASDGSQANGDSGYIAISADARFVAFESQASNLVAGDTNNHWDIFVRDLETGQTTRVSVASDGTQANGDSGRPALSADGRFVAFESAATNLVAGDTNGAWDIFVHDRQTGQTTRVSVGSGGAQANSNSFDPTISGDGHIVAFDSYASNLVSADTNNASDIFVRNLLPGTTTLVSRNSAGTQANSYCDNPSISTDGQLVAFDSIATNLVDSDTNGKSDVFLHDLRAGETKRISASSNGTQGDGDSYSPGIAGTGRYIAFESSATNLVPGDSNGALDVFVYDLQLGRVMRANVATDGSQSNGGAIPLHTPSVSAGGIVAFDSAASNLVTGDTNGLSDIFVRDPGTSSSSPLDYFGFSVIPSPQSVGSAFSVTITALDAAGARVYADFDLSLIASLGRVSPLQAHLTKGSAILSLALDGAGQGVLLAASGGGATGESNPFDVTAGSGSTGTLAGMVTQATPSNLSEALGSRALATPVSGATVTLMSSSGTETRITNSSGEYIFSGKPCKTYTLYATNAQSTTAAVSIRIPCSSTTTADLVLASCPSGVTPILLVPGVLGSTKPGAWITPELPGGSPPSYFGPDWGIWSDNTLSNRAAGLHDPLGAAGWRNLAATLEQASTSYLTGCTIVPVPWDWRMPLDDAVKKYLIPAIQDAKQATHSAKVHIVAHSMGGLLARAYIQSNLYANDVDKFAMVGTPNLGAANAFLLWQGGDPQTADLLASNLLSGWFPKLYPQNILTADFYTASTESLSNALRGRPVLLDPNSPPENPPLLLRSDVADLYHTHVDSVRQLEPTWPVLVPRGALRCPTVNGIEWTNSWLDDLNQPSAARDRMVKEDGPLASVRTKIFAGTGHETIYYMPSGSGQCNNSLYPDGKPQAVPTGDKQSVLHHPGDGTVPLFSTYGGSDQTALGAHVSYVSTQSGEHSSLIDTYKCDIVKFLLGTVSCTTSTSAAMDATDTAAGSTGTLSVAILGRPQPYVSAPGGKASGINPTTGARETGIVDSSVTMQGDSGVVSLLNPTDGSYSIALSSTYTEDYQLQLAYVAEGASESTEVTAFYSGLKTINFTFDSTGSPKITLNHNPVPPTGLRTDALGSSNRFTRLSWQAHPDPQVAGFNIYGKLAVSPKFAKIGSTAGTTFTPGDHWAEDATQPVRAYAISAYYSDGSESFLSPVVLNDDRDHDGITDLQETALGTNPDNPDTDGDGLSDGAEVQLGTSPLLTDTDGDGIPDNQEVLGGSDPLDPASIPGMRFFIVPPCRLVDTRGVAGPTGGPALQSGATRLFSLTGKCGIPNTARSLSLNVTVVGPTNAGYVSLFPGDKAAPLVSTVNFVTGKTRTNNAIVPLAADVSRMLAASTAVVSSGHVDIVIDVNGYFDSP